MAEILNTTKAPLAIGPYVQGVNLGNGHYLGAITN